MMGGLYSHFNRVNNIKSKFNSTRLSSSLIDAIGLLTFKGQAAASFLQGQLTCDISAITQNASPVFGGYCNRQGRLLASFYLFLQEDDYHACLPYETLSPLLTAMQAYARLAKVSLIDNSEQAELKAHYLSSIAPACLSLNDWHLYNIQQGIGYIYKETIGLFTPHQLEYPALGAVSFTKGCYLGQEIIARMEHRGKRKYQRYKARLTSKEAASPPLPGKPVVNAEGTKVGAVVDSAQLDASNNYLVMLSAPIQPATDKSAPPPLYIGQPYQTPDAANILTELTPYGTAAHRD